MSASEFRWLRLATVPALLATAALAAGVLLPTGDGGLAAGPEQGAALNLVSQTGGITAGVVLGGQQVVAGVGANLVVLEAPPDGEATVTGAVPVAGVVQGLAFDGRYAYLAADDAGLQVVDLADPAAPRVIASLVDPEGAMAWAVFAEANRATMAERTGIGDRLTVVDISQPGAPRVLGGYEPLDGIIEGASVQGTMAYVVNGEQLIVVDLSDPAAPRELSTFDQLSEALGVTAAGDRVYVTDVRFDSTDFTYRYTVRILDVADPATPMLLGSYEVPGTVREVNVVAETMYISRADALELVDASVPARAVSLGAYSLPGGAVTTSVEGDRLAVAPGAGGVLWLDAADPSAIQELARYEVPVAAHDVAVAGDRMVLVENIVASGLRLLDVSDPTEPVVQGYLALPGEALQVDLAGDYVYVADGLGGLRVVDVSDPLSPQQVGAYLGVELVLGVAVAGDYAFLAASGDGLRVVDISDPLAPREVGAFRLPDQAFGVAVGAGRVYLSGRRDVWVLDVSDPTDPQPMAGILVESYLGRLAVDGYRLYVPAPEGLQVLDVTDPTQAVDLGTVPIDEGANDVAVGVGMAYVTSAIGLHAVDLTRMAEVARYVTPAFAEGVAAEAGLAFAAAYDAGLFTLRLGAAPPATPTTTPPRVTATPTPSEATPTPDGLAMRVFLPYAQRPE